MDSSIGIDIPKIKYELLNTYYHNGNNMKMIYSKLSYTFIEL